MSNARTASSAGSTQTTTDQGAPTIAVQPASQMVTTKQLATFVVMANGGARLTYQWQKNGAVIFGSNLATYTTPATEPTDNGSQFSVVVSNPAGSTTSNAASLTVSATPVAPSISAQPVSQTVTTGQTATFSVTATGTAPLSYQWQKNGSAVSGATSASYTTPATTSANGGSQFTVVISNGTGSVTSNAAMLTVNAAAVAPSISVQPVSQTVTTGQTATFSVTATGTAPLSYQWQKNGSAVSGATSASYTTPATTSANGGSQFTVVISNGTGSVTSNAAMLTVNAAPSQLTASTSTLAFGNVNTGSSKVLAVSFTDSGSSNITIGNIGIAGAGFTTAGASSAGLSSGLILSPGQTATLDVFFAPATTSAVTGTVTVASNAANSSVAVTLTGTGTQSAAPTALLSWSPTTSATGYNVYRSTVSGGPYTKLNSSLITTTQYTDNTVQSGQAYYYVVTSVNSSNVESAYSAEVSAVIPAD